MDDSADMGFEESQDSRLSRFLGFLRSILPVDLWQLVFLAGLICVGVGSRLRWILAVSPQEAETFQRLMQTSPGNFTIYFPFVFFLATLGTSVGFALYLWKSKRPMRLILLGVCLPVVLGIIAILGWHLYLENASLSILIKPAWRSNLFGLQPSKIWNYGPGIHFCLVGVLFVFAFATRVSLGISMLPVSLPQPKEEGTDFLNSPAKILLWLTLGSQLLLAGPLMALFWAGMRSIKGMETFEGPLFVGGLCLESLIFLWIVLWLVGKQTRENILRRLSPPAIEWLGLGIAIPVALSSLIPVATLVRDRIHWAAFDYGKFHPPYLSSYFPTSLDWLVLPYFTGALLEEVVFRGVLQDYFARRYGVHRGILLVALAWGASHFYGDARVGTTRGDLTEIWMLAWRMVICLSLGYVLSWLTIRSGSLCPGTIAHGIYNVLSSNGAPTQFENEKYIVIALWAVLAGVLFRYWPIWQNTGRNILPPETPILDV
jgi:membrane protease YdiL (CAAX protease family)